MAKQVHINSPAVRFKNVINSGIIIRKTIKSLLCHVRFIIDEKQKKRKRQYRKYSLTRRAPG